MPGPMYKIKVKCESKSYRKYWIKNSNGLLKYFGGHKIRRESLLTWSDVFCVCPLIDHDQQPIKMHTEVMLLYNAL